MDLGRVSDSWVCVQLIMSVLEIDSCSVLLSCSILLVIVLYLWFRVWDS